ncbi:Pyridine nucleotide-disulfide oxidoreductase [Globisporangium polare]
MPRIVITGVGPSGFAVAQALAKIVKAQNTLDASNHPTLKLAYWAGQQGTFLATELVAVLRSKQSAFTKPSPKVEVEALLLLLPLGPCGGVSQLPVWGCGTVVGDTEWRLSCREAVALEDEQTETEQEPALVLEAEHEQEELRQAQVQLWGRMEDNEQGRDQVLEAEQQQDETRQAQACLWDQVQEHERQREQQTAHAEAEQAWVTSHRRLGSEINARRDARILESEQGAWIMRRLDRDGSNL